jgi:hypothetical protein
VVVSFAVKKLAKGEQLLGPVRQLMFWQRVRASKLMVDFVV